MWTTPLSLKCTIDSFELGSWTRFLGVVAKDLTTAKKTCTFFFNYLGDRTFLTDDFTTFDGGDALASRSGVYAQSNWRIDFQRAPWGGRTSPLRHVNRFPQWCSQQHASFRITRFALFWFCMICFPIDCSEIWPTCLCENKVPHLEIRIRSLSEKVWKSVFHIFQANFNP